VSDAYVIVGAGSAGCVLAARLSEDPAGSVLLLEAGPTDTQQEIHVPVAFGSLMKSALDWDFVTEPESGLDDRRAYLPRGRMLGGSSSMNAMIYIRGHRADYDEWAGIGGAGWGYDAVLPYFKRSEDNQRGASEFHGSGGPLTVSDTRAATPMCDAWVEAAVAAGMPVNDDFNGAEQDGAGRYQLTQRNGMRCSAAVAFLHPVLERDNLTVLTGATAHRVVFEGGRAVGVEYERGGEITTARAEREVILSAGAYQSPQLLMLSGIGPADEIAKFGIEPRLDLPVGEGLEDHFAVVMTWFTDEESLMTALTPDNVALMQSEGRGPLTSNIAETGAFFRTDPSLPAPDSQIHCGPVMFHEEGLGLLTAHAMFCGPCLLTPTSRGKVALRSMMPIAKPRITHSYLTTEEDRQRVYAMVRTTMETMKESPVAGLITGEHRVPASTSDSDILLFAQRRGHTLYHPTSTCAMGAVVDTELRVFGAEGLRVVDASVMPSVPRANTNAPTIMVAERAADMIRGTVGAGT
jgi:choline dehydrogenase